MTEVELVITEVELVKTELELVMTEVERVKTADELIAGSRHKKIVFAHSNAGQIGRLIPKAFHVTRFNRPGVVRKTGSLTTPPFLTII